MYYILCSLAAPLETQDPSTFASDSPLPIGPFERTRWQVRTGDLLYEDQTLSASSHLTVGPSSFSYALKSGTEIYDIAGDYIGHASPAAKYELYVELANLLGHNLVKARSDLQSCITRFHKYAALLGTKSCAASSWSVNLLS